MTKGHRGTAPLAAPCPAKAPCHFGRGTGFVDRDQSLRLQIRLDLEQGVAPSQNVMALLLAGVCAFEDNASATKNA